MKIMKSEENKNRKKKFVNIRKVIADLSPNVVKNLLFIHALSGCDTTSGIFNQGKLMVLKLVDNNNSKAMAICEVFNSIEFTPEIIAEAGSKMFIHTYGKYSCIKISVDICLPVSFI